MHQLTTKFITERLNSVGRRPLSRSPPTLRSLLSLNLREIEAQMTLILMSFNHGIHMNSLTLQISGLVLLRPLCPSLRISVNLVATFPQLEVRTAHVETSLFVRGQRNESLRSTPPSFAILFARHEHFCTSLQ